jgi:hypothetical protein
VRCHQQYRLIPAVVAAARLPQSPAALWATGTRCPASACSQLRKQKASNQRHRLKVADYGGCGLLEVLSNGCLRATYGDFRRADEC